MGTNLSVQTRIQSTVSCSVPVHQWLEVTMEFVDLRGVAVAVTTGICGDGVYTVHSQHILKTDTLDLPT